MMVSMVRIHPGSHFFQQKSVTPPRLDVVSGDRPCGEERQVPPAKSSCISTRASGLILLRSVLTAELRRNGRRIYPAKSSSSFLIFNWFSGGIAQLVEQRTHKPRVGGSFPPPAILLRSVLNGRASQEYAEQSIQ